jgi:hypothetical protein
MESQMGRPRKTASTAGTAGGADGNLFRRFALAATAIDSAYRDALDELERTALLPELKEALRGKLAEILRSEITSLCSGEPRDIPADYREASQRALALVQATNDDGGEEHAADAGGAL